MATYTDNYQLTKPTYAEQADISVINSNMNIIDDIMHSSQVSLAPAYDQSKTYAEGDVVMYELLMYKCISPTTGNWDASKWERTTASESGGGGSAELDILGEGNGAVVSFSDGASAELAKCIVEIVPKQAGSGTPSPSNVRAISGSTFVTITVSDGTNDTTYTTALGQTVYGGQLNVLTGELSIDRAFLQINGDTSISWATQSSWTAGCWYNGTIMAGAKNISGYSTKANIVSNMGEAQTPSDLADNVEFGVAHGNGTTLYVRVDNTLDTADKFRTFLNNSPLQIVYELATPQTVQLTPQEVNSLLGQNNISADTGDIDIVYVKASAPIQPNPTGTPTATLKKLGIEGTVFELEGGGGGGNVYGAFVDTNRIIKANTTFNSDTSYIATEDCAVVYSIAVNTGTNGQVYVDGKEINAFYSGNGIMQPTDTIYLKAGQTVSFKPTYSSGTSSYTVYGLTFGTQNIFTPQIYSTEERCVGVWIDNKPLYCKTFPITATVITTSGVSIPSIDISGMDDIIRAEGVSNNKQETPLMAYDSNGLKVSSPQAIEIDNVVLWYTKTTDIAGSGSFNTLGVPARHYDTTEKVVGTVEMDNGIIKPLYEKSWWLTIPSQSGGYIFPNTSMADLDQVISNEYSFNGKGMKSYTYWYTGASIVFDEHTSSGISFYFGSSDYSGAKIFYTARYTKITD